MRVLLAFDGSQAAHVAVDLARWMRWPEGTVIRLAHVAPTVRLLGGLGPLLPVAGTGADTGMMRAAESLRRAGLSVEARVLSGDGPADALLREAASMSADLIVAGHRGHGPLATVLLGSVARELAERSGCPVLVARRTRCASLVFAEDGSDGAYRARRVLARWRIFTGLPVQVVSVSHVRRPLLSGVAPTMRDEAREAQSDLEAESRLAHRRLAEDAAQDLRLAGLSASADVVEADAADGIIAAARHTDADLIVMGTRGRGAVARVVMGSVARAVLLSAPCSVFIVPSS
jgi:nucleotide-binding universal stress UspA family protein